MLYFTLLILLWLQLTPMLGRKFQKLFFFTLLLAININASATDLLDAYQLGLLHDPTYKAAIANYLTKKEASPQAWSAILPQIVGNADVTSMRKKILLGGHRADMSPYNLGANLSQVIFDWGVFNRIREARSTVKQATYTLAAAKQDLMIQVARAYFNVLLEQDNVLYSQQQRDGALQQLRATRERFKVGHATITSLEQFQGQYELLRAQVDSDKITLSNRSEKLGEIIGRQFGTLAPLKNHFILAKPNPEKLSPWLTKARETNLSFEAARYGLMAARESIQVAQGDHLPTLNMTASYERSKTPSLLTQVGAETSTVGLKLSFPIFKGGATNSQVRKARAQYKLSAANFEQAYRVTLSNTRQAYNALILGVGQLSAEKRNVQFNRSALAHVEEGYTAGIQTTLDVIQQQNRLLVAQREYARDRYTYLLNILLLEQAVGTLKPQSLAIIQAVAITHDKKTVPSG